MNSTTKPATLVFDEVLDGAACSAMRRFQKRALGASRSSAAIDLRRTRVIASSAWATLVKAVRDLKTNGHEVTIIAGERLQGLLEITGLVRHARVVYVATDP